MFYQNLKRVGVHLGFALLAAGLAWAANNVVDLGIPGQYQATFIGIVTALGSLLRTPEGVEAMNKELEK